MNMKDSRELDVQIATKVMGWNICDTADDDKAGIAPGQTCSAIRVPNYSTNIAAAWEVALAVMKRFGRIELVGDCEEDGTPFFWFSIGGEIDDADFKYSAETASLAICLAALKAVGVEA